MNGHLVNGFTSGGNDSSEDSDDDMPLELPPSPKVQLKKKTIQINKIFYLCIYNF